MLQEMISGNQTISTECNKGHSVNPAVALQVMHQS